MTNKINICLEDKLKKKKEREGTNTILGMKTGSNKD